MTTTLRPTGPEHRTADGRRSRTYEICVNSRPVGGLDLAGPPEGGPASGRIAGLTVEPGERRRGRGTVAALAAEEVLRDWGAVYVETSVPVTGEEDAAGTGLLASLGYTERSRHMVKDVDAPPSLPPGSVPRPLTADEFEQWWDKSAATFIDGMTARGATPQEAAVRSEAARRIHLPDGAATRTAALRVLTRDGVDVGAIWLAFAGLPRDDVDAWVFDVHVETERRGEGHGRTLMLAAEQVCAERGARLLGLNVFSDNTPALRLYTSLGYRLVELCYAKRLV
ncbi:GNAT family N-acetyltransferase [Streptomyces albus]|uniref:GNAT family N-acetyltransferase n=1 Tax=Streptomyces TaxID=1883 RepID=UPI0004C49195|nr:MULTISPECIES: GNAT family N-acetyltransferase [Streptomyces]KPC93455.1 hypothetical protein ADL27_19910 [Streptomyces sp. NRRL F-6602]